MMRYAPSLRSEPYFKEKRRDHSLEPLIRSLQAIWIAALILLAALPAQAVGAPDANRYLFDHRQLERFSIPLSQLPKDAVFVNRPDSFYDKHEGYVWGAVTAVSVLTGLVILLGITIARRRRAEQALQESETNFRSIVENALAGIFVVDDAYHFVYANDELCRLLGYSREELIGMDFREALSGESRDIVADRYVRRQRGEQVPARYELGTVRRDGEVRQIEMSATVVRDATGRPRSIGQMVDITERKRVEDALRRSEEKFRSLVETTSDWVWEVGETGAYTYSSPKVRDLLGYEPEEVLGKRPFDFMSTAEGERVARAFQEARRLGNPLVALENTNLHRSGQPVVLETSAVPIFDAEGNLLGYRGIDRDITERKRAEDALRESEFFLNRSQQVARIGSYKFESSTGTWISSPSLDDIFGIDTRFPRIVNGWLGLVAPEDREVMRDYLLRHVLTEHNRFDREYRIMRHSDGQKRWVHGLGELEFDNQGKAVKMIGTIQDITERKQAEEALRESEERLRLALKAADQGLYDLNVQTGEAQVNPEYATMLGYDPEEFHETNAAWMDRLHPEDHERASAIYRDYIAGRIPEYQVEFRQRTKSGYWKWILSLGKIVEWDARGEPLRMLGTHTDITVRKQAEERLKASLQDKEILLKEIHHRVKNNLQIVTSLLALQARYLEDEHAQGVFRESEHRVRSMALIHEQLYSTPDLARIDFARYVESLVTYLFQASVSPTNAVAFRVDIPAIFLSLDAAVPCGLIINELITNSLKHAFVGRPGGEIRVMMRAAGDQLTLSVKDDGVGFPRETDFRHTESLGLTIVTTLVGQLKGAIALHSGPGTEFAITFSDIHPPGEVSHG